MPSHLGTPRLCFSLKLGKLGWRPGERISPGRPAVPALVPGRGRTNARLAPDRRGRRETQRRGGSAAGGQRECGLGRGALDAIKESRPVRGAAEARRAEARAGGEERLVSIRACVSVAKRQNAVERPAPDALRGSAWVRRRRGSARGMAGRSGPIRVAGRPGGTVQIGLLRKGRSGALRTCTADTPPLRRVQRAVSGAHPVRRRARAARDRSYLVDPASSHMLVSKIKPCMSKYKQFVL